MSKKKILLGVAVAAAVGSALGILMAPAKGANTRKKLSQKGNDVAKSAKKIVKQYSSVTGKEYDKVAKEVGKIVKKGKKKTSTLLH
ncbi:MAG: YtxH domain-containing protein [Bacteroidota bacterium]|jgi:gas vesicle protein